jgi:uncharacterized protein YdeI (YjbR/CyaY-like superfamily)
MITDATDYFAKGCGRCDRFATPHCSTRRWLSGLEALRRICLDVGLVETAKWGQPCYMYAGRNIAVFGAYRHYFRLSFFHAALLKDPAKVLEPAGPNTRQPSIIRFLESTQVEEMEQTIRVYLKEAMVYAEKGLLPAKVAAAIELPDELIEALDAAPELAEAFYLLTPGRQRSYIFSISEAKRPATRIARIAKFHDKILAGKGALER